MTQRILIVDDQAHVRTAIVQLLVGCNRPDLHIDQLSNGADALRKLQAIDYNLLITDTVMPGMQGMALIQSLRAEERLKTLPVILMLDVGAGKKDVLDAVALGISGFVIKPFKHDQLVLQIRKIMNWPAE